MASNYLTAESLILAMYAVLSEDPRAIENDADRDAVLSRAGFSDAQIEDHAAKAANRVRIIRDHLRLVRAL